MRRLVAKREVITEVDVPAQLGRLYIEEAPPADYQVLGLIVLFRFTYNSTQYVVVYAGVGADLSRTALTSAGVASYETPIVWQMVVMPLYMAGDIAWAESPIYSKVAAALGCRILPSDTYLKTTIEADSPDPAKRFTDIVIVNTTYVTTVTASIVSVTTKELSSQLVEPFDLDIDSNTSIGISYKGYNPSKPTEIGFKGSNSFTIPYTPNNAKLVGFMGTNDRCYDAWYLSYIVDNNIVISNAKAGVSSVSGILSTGDADNGRMSLILSEKNTMWDRLANLTWPDFMGEYYNWLAANNDLIFNDSIFFNQFKQGGNSHVVLSAIQGDHHPDSKIDLPDIYAPNRQHPMSTLVAEIYTYGGGIMSTYVGSIFEFLQTKYGIAIKYFENNVQTNCKLFFQNRFLSPQHVTGSSIQLKFLKGRVDSSTGKYVSDKQKLSVMDFVKAFVIHTGCLIDVVDSTTVELHRLDDIAQAPALDFSGVIERGSIEFAPTISGVSQNNYINYKKYSAAIADGSLRLSLPSDNKSLDASSEYITLEEFAPPSYIDRDTGILGFFESGSSDLFTFLKHGENFSTYQVNTYSFYGDSSVVVSLDTAQLADVGYAQWGEMIKKPVIFKIKKWINSTDFEMLKLYQRYWIDELQGSFMLLNISGFNPEKSNSPTELTFILINRTKPTNI